MGAAKSKRAPFCSKVLTIDQVGPTCWFLATFMAMFYSQRSRKLLIEASKHWDERIEIFRILKHILLYKYMKTDNIKEDYKYFELITAESILSILNKHDSNEFGFDPTKKEGFFTESYISKLYKFLGVDSLMLERVGSKIAYSIFNHYTINDKLMPVADIKSPDFIENQLKKYKTPSVIILVLSDSTDPQRSWYKVAYDMRTGSYLTDKKNVANLRSLDDKIYYNGEEYNLDSVILSNWNRKEYHRKNVGHAICGITCKNERYVYNGWTRYTLDPNIAKGAKGQDKYLDLPCELMKLKWSIKDEHDFCLNTAKCIPDHTNISKKQNLCFSFNKGKRVLIYVKKNMASQTSNDNETDQEYKEPPKNITPPKAPSPNKPLNIPHTIPEKKCPEGKILNPFTKRCINIKGSVAKKKNLIKPTENVPKICPPGKTLNPITNRCVKTANLQKNIPNKGPKICPPGKYLNPITNRCKKIKRSYIKKLIKNKPLNLKPDILKPAKKNTNILKKTNNNVSPHQFIKRIVPSNIEPVPPIQKRIGEPRPKSKTKTHIADNTDHLPVRKLSPVSPINPNKKILPSQYLNSGPFIPKHKPMIKRH
jgi:hypothetical protein